MAHIMKWKWNTDKYLLESRYTQYNIYKRYPNVALCVWLYENQRLNL